LEGSLLSVCWNILAHRGDAPEAYYMRLEAYWILTNLTMGDETESILQYQPSPAAQTFVQILET
jgi:hypothetical protein